MKGSLICWLLRRLIRDRWDATYGDIVKEKIKNNVIKNHNDSVNKSSNHHLIHLYGYWSDGRVCGEIWCHGTSKETSQNTELFSELVAPECTSQKGEVTIEIPSTTSSVIYHELTNLIGPEEDVLLYGKLLKNKIPYICKLSPKPLVLPRKEPVIIHLDEIFRGNSFQVCL